MEMHHAEQLLASIDLLAHKVDSLAEANAALKNYGPESFHGNRILVKRKSEASNTLYALYAKYAKYAKYANVLVEKRTLVVKSKI